MAVVTISAALGTGAGAIAGELAARTGMALFDRSSLAAIAHELDPTIDGLEELERIEERLGGRLETLALSIAATAGAADAYRELQLRRTLPELARAVLREAARQPAVILAPAAFAALADHPGALHVRLHAPFPWRVAAYERRHLVDRRCAEKAVKHDDHVKHAWVRALYHADVEDAARFSLAVDVSRFTPDRVVDILLTAAGLRAAV